MLSNNQQAFLALVRAGLWEKEVQLLAFGKTDFSEVYRLAQEQSISGLVAAGLEHVADTKIPQEIALTFAGETLQIEQRNIAMNFFIGVIVDKMRNAGIYTLLIKGQGVAQCYERPLWRASGDIDFYLSESNYKKAIQFLRPLASNVEKEDLFKKHLAFTLVPWEVELHGSLRCGLWRRLDDTLDEVHNKIFCGGAVRMWMNGSSQVFLPRADEDAVFVFAHILQHFFKGGIGLRQVCDWCRLLWTYRGSIKDDLLEQYLKGMQMMSEWKAFAALAVDFLGMPAEAMPFYSPARCWKRKASRILAIIFETGNFGHNIDNSYYQNKSFLIRKIISFYRHSMYSIKCGCIFPYDSTRLWGKMFREGLIGINE